jgi:hypothetical protein
MKGSVRRELFFDTAESEALGMCGNSMRENREALQTPALDGSVGRSKKAKSRNVDMHVCGESDGFIVPTKRANKVDAYALAAESAEGRRPAKGNALQAYLRRTQSRGCKSQGLWLVRQARVAGRQMNPRQEPYEVIPHVRIRAGGRSQGRSLPRLTPGLNCILLQSNLVNTSLRTVKENFTRKFDRLNSDEDMFCLD